MSTEYEARLPFTARTNSGRVLDLNLCLHPHTASSEHVGLLIERVLDAVSEIIEEEEDVGDGDIIQALTLAAAVRLSVADVPAGTSKKLLADLLDLAAASAGTSKAGQQH